MIPFLRTNGRTPWAFLLLFFSRKIWGSRPCSLASLGLNSEPCCCLTLALGQMNMAAIQERAALLFFIHESSFSGSSPLYCDNALDKGAGTSIIHLLMLAKSAHTCCCTSRCTGGHGAYCDLPAVPLHPRQLGQLTGEPRAGPRWHRFPCCQHTISHRAALLFGKTSPQGQRRATRYISACLTTDFCLQGAFQVEGCRYLHCSQVRRLPRGTGVPESAALHPEITKRQFLPSELAIIIIAIIT